MAKSMKNRIKYALHSAEGLYHRLVLLVGESGSGKTHILHDISDELGTEVININLMLSSELLELTAKQRALRLPGILEQIIEKAQPPVVLDNIEILLDKGLQQDPLRLLQGISRNHTVVASWNGTNTGGRLSYAEPGHPEYRCYDAVDALIVEMDGKATAGSDKEY